MRFGSLTCLLALTGCWSTWSAPIDTGVDGDSNLDSDSAADSDGETDSPGDTADDPDGDGWTSAQGDCDESDAAINPGATENCGTVEDDDCSGDTNDPDAIGCTDLHPDADGDGAGGESTLCLCEATADWPETDASDCDDGESGVHPGADEVCDGIDQDCDGDADNDPIDLKTWYLDADGDGYGGETSTNACDAPTSAYVETPGDCDDGLKSVNPDATEICNERDDDCDGDSDIDAADALTWYEDEDEDGFGGAVVLACEAPAGTIDEAGDCDDLDPTINPDGIETCDEVDQDCDGSVDEDPSDGATWWTDADADGYGDATSTVIACLLPTGAAENADDCDDTDGARHPGVSELADGVDQDCDGTTDEETEVYDDDLDGFAETGGDCDDADPDTFPGATEVCDDGVVNDCEGDAEAARGECYAAGTSTTRFWTGSSFRDHAVVDVTGDSTPDLLGMKASTANEVLVSMGPLDPDSGGLGTGIALSLPDEGFGVAAVGDVNGDGVGDLAFNTYDAIFVVEGPLVSDLDLTASPGEFELDATVFGEPSGAIDLTGAGVNSILVSSFTAAGPVAVLPGAATGTGIASDEAILTIDGVKNAMSADIDGDGVGDIVASTDGGTGDVAYFFLAPASGALAVGDENSAVEGAYVLTTSGALDVDGDGADDVLLETDSDSEGGGRPLLFTGLSVKLPVSQSEATATIDRNTAELVGDVDGDGEVDAAGIRGGDEFFLIFGPLSGLMGTDDWTSCCTSHDAILGGEFDVDGDGLGDVVGSGEVWFGMSY